ncbi:fungal-specific transcription factor domain-containing protein [Penicillium cataractarum]|uniref:Fungal-specific transcription factor domain-containing protein n=1 Tax=Penicillium cataractarum TaxID=2100454 RepID=A0A9W9R7C8_9EURO|nr:fungal-specific transcription factor domain-containing protein [Penicillium cataractarum]KAJ5355025.1 fungal-specific transcription factor domain-containing protein [Penicillium cataractarum]
MPEISSPDPPSPGASRMGSELPTSRSIGAEEASLPDNPEDEERNGLEIASAALGQPEKMGEVPFYAGGHTGPTSALDICFTEQSLPRHFLIPLHRTSLSEENKEFLRKKGVYTLPGKKACESLVEAYLLNVHPILPVIEADVLLSHYQAGQLERYNILLLWSLFFVAVNFIPSQICEQEGFTSRRAIKFAMYSRAKCMYENGNERNKIVLLQASLLMGFWHSEIDEHAQPWYWTGSAISHCQILGLHRDPGTSAYNPHITDRQRAFWRRLWWCCFFRDRWLGLTLGRPLRINLNDSDVPMPLVGDMLFDIESLGELGLGGHLPSDMPRLSEYWVMLIEMSRQLGDVLVMNFQAARPRGTLDDVKKLEKDLLRCRLPDLYEGGLTRISKFYSNHVHLHYQALLITFYRPWGMESPDGIDPGAKEDWKERMRLKADHAASQTNEILDRLVQDGLIGLAGPMTPPLLVPAMQTHLLQCKCGDPLARRIRLNKLEVCMLVMEELQKTYTVASVYRGIFTKAIQQIFPDCPDRAMHTSRSPTSIPVPRSEGLARNLSSDGQDADASGQLGESDFGVLDGDDLMAALMDNASVFDFWQACNQV